MGHGRLQVLELTKRKDEENEDGYAGLRAVGRARVPSNMSKNPCAPRRPGYGIGSLHPAAVLALVPGIGYHALRKSNFFQMSFFGVEGKTLPIKGNERRNTCRPRTWVDLVEKQPQMTLIVRNRFFNEKNKKTPDV